MACSRIAGLIFALVVGWAWRLRVALDEAGFGDGWLGRTWLFVLHWPTPILIVLALARSVGLL